MKLSSHLPRRCRWAVLVVALMTLASALCLPLTAAAAPSVSAKSAVLIEAETGRVLYQKNAFVRLPMASTTKIMTALVAIGSGNIDRVVTIPPEATGIEGSSVYLYPDEKLTLRQLIYALLLESANDAATAIAIEVAGSVEDFAVLMNRKAAELGLTATHFMNPHGLDHEAHYTTAFDLARIAAAALAEPVFRDICSTTRKTIPLKGDEGTRVLVNHNKMLTQYEGAIGVKTGFTKKSGRCLVSAAERDGLTLVAVTLCAPDDWDDHAAMLDFGFARYERESFADTGSLSLEFPVVGGTSGTVAVQNTEALSALLSREHGTVTRRVEASRFLYAPVARGQIVGRVVYECDGVEIASSPLVAASEVVSMRTEKQGFLSWLRRIFGG